MTNVLFIYTLSLRSSGLLLLLSITILYQLLVVTYDDFIANLLLRLANSSSTVGVEGDSDRDLLLEDLLLLLWGEYERLLLELLDRDLLL